MHLPVSGSTRIEPLGLTVTKAAELLGIKRQTLNNLVNGKAGISPEMSIRLSKAFGSSAEVWLGMQMEYDLAQANMNAGRIKVQRITTSTPRPDFGKYCWGAARSLAARTEP
jgi:antitoxin HigA-1